MTNAFFWAIGRSHDATFFHDWFTKTGQQARGGEYRYVLAPEAPGNAFHRSTRRGSPRRSTAWRHHARAQVSRSTATCAEAARQVRARGQRRLLLRHRTQQTYQQESTTRPTGTRRFGRNVTGNWGEYSLQRDARISEMFSSSGHTRHDATAPPGEPRAASGRSATRRSIRRHRRIRRSIRKRDDGKHRWTGA